MSALLKDILKHIKQEVPTITTAYIRSDNAVCYHGSKMTATVPHISEISGVTIKRWDYSEPQSGKGPCDRAAAWIKHRVWDKVAQNQPASTPEQFADAGWTQRCFQYSRNDCTTRRKATTGSNC